MDSAQGFRERLRERGIRPSRHRGQNFLLDRNLLEAMVRDANVVPGDRILEIGCGPGFLTERLVAAGAAVLAIEIDKGLLAIARESLAKGAMVEWLEGDVLAGKNRLSRVVEAALDSFRPRALIANLPYAVATPCLVLLSRWSPALSRMNALVQLEVAERICASPGTKAYGAVSVRLQARYRTRILRRVPPQVFWPRPRVQSASVELVLRDSPPDAGIFEELEELLEAGFRTRRKRLLGGVRALAPEPFWKKILTGMSLPDGVRGEEIGVDQFLALASGLRRYRAEGAMGSDP